jgi:hypothetical protein
MIENVAEKKLVWFFLKQNVYMDAKLLFLLECKVTLNLVATKRSSYHPLGWVKSLVNNLVLNQLKCVIRKRFPHALCLFFKLCKSYN